MANLKIWIVLLTCMAFAVMASGQTPFDLHHRLSEPVEHLQDTKVDSTVDSSLVVQAEKDSVSIDTSSTLSVIDTTKASKSTPPINRRDLDNNDEGTTESPVSPSSELSEQRKRNLIFGTFILLVLYLTVVISFRRSVVNEIFRSILNDNYLNLLLRKLRSRGLSQFVFLYFFSVINGGLFLFLVSEQTELISLEVNLLTISAVIAAIYLVRHLTLGLLAGIFPIEKPMYQYSFTILIFNLFLGLILFPANLFIAFSPDILINYFIYFALSIITLFYFLRQLRGLFIAAPLLSQYKFHFLLYLCTIEIAPLAVLYKFFQPYFS